jgi:hypothetical protein
VDFKRSGTVKQCSSDCCVHLSAEEVRRFAEGEDEHIPGETEANNSPYPRYASTSPPSTGSGDAHPPAETNKQITPTQTVSAPGISSVHSHLPPVSTAATVSNAYPNYGQFVPSNIDGAVSTPNEPFTYTNQLEEQWLYTPASAHAAFAMDYSPSSAEAFDGLNPWSHRRMDGSSQAQQLHYQLAMQASQSMGSMSGYPGSSQTPVPGPNDNNGMWSGYGHPPHQPRHPQHAVWN